MTNGTHGVVGSPVVACAEARATFARRRHERSLTLPLTAALARPSTLIASFLALVYEFPDESVGFSAADRTLQRAARRACRLT
jgi:hypothetical protein